MQQENATSRSSVRDDIDRIARMDVVPRILRVAAQITGMRFTAIARVTETSWTACAVHDQIDFGLQPGGELVLGTTICNEIRQHHRPVVISDVAQDEAYRDHPTPKLYGLASYISVPIFRADGGFFGTLCAIDPLPAKLDDPSIVETFTLFGQLIAAQLEMQDSVRESHAKVAAADEVALLRDQFIAVLGHDLRNPLQAIAMAAELLHRLPLDARASRPVDAIARSAQRMGELIENILDFARGRLGGGIPVELALNALVDIDINRSVAEVRSAYPDRTIELTVDTPHAVRIDTRRMAQLLVNLLVNAAVHGEPGVPILVSAVTTDQWFEITVVNRGTPIDPRNLARLFQPFSRHDHDGPKQGLGLGLYIAAEVAKAHDGTLTVASSAESGTAFTFRMPLLGGVD